MLDALRLLGVTDQAVLSAMGRVPRHEYARHFWTVPLAGAFRRHALRECTIGERCSEVDLEAAYDPEAALLLRLPALEGTATSSVSAPIIVALMLEELRLQPGLRVLEIGTGSGYNAALLAELLGDPSLVTTIDIDEELTEAAAVRLYAAGYEGVDVRSGDGSTGAADRAPFDRIVATVGCIDLSPAWAAQLAPDGELLVPLEHGAMHPRVALRASGEGGDRELVGRFIGRSAFVRMQGSQSSHRLWTGDMPTPAKPARVPLPRLLRAALHPKELPTEQARRRPWDLALYLALRDSRVLTGMGLGDGTSQVLLQEGALAVDGPQADLLAARFVRLGLDWVELGCPGLDRYQLHFDPVGSPAMLGPAESVEGPWVIDRIDFREHVALVA